MGAVEGPVPDPEQEERRRVFNENSPVKATPEEFLWLEKEMGLKASEGLADPGRRMFLKRSAAAAAGFIVGGSMLAAAIDLLKKEKADHHRKIDSAGDKKSQSNRPEIKIENLADHYLEAYYRVSFDESKFPDELFEKDLLIAQQCQESRGDVDAKSHSGALGVMQNMTVCLVDVTRYLNILKNKTGFKWDGPSELGKEEVMELKRLITEKSDYSRAFGKIYLMQLWDDEYGYGVGRKAFASGGIKQAQTELMGSYNAGFGRIKGKSITEWERLRDRYKGDKSKASQKEYRAYNEAITYVHRIFNYKQRLGNIRKIFQELDIVFDGNEDYAARQIALKLDEVTGIPPGQRAETLRKRTYDLARLFKNINKTEGRGPTYDEIDKLVPAGGMN